MVRPFQVSGVAIIVAGAVVGAVATGASAQSADLTGEDAYGGWRSDAPGVSRLIRPADLPPPFASRSVGHGAGIQARPAERVPVVPDGFTAELFAEDLAGPRTMRVAPNGDVFVAESSGGRISVISGDRRTVFADDLVAPYGIAFYPTETPEWVYVAETHRIVRYPYSVGDMTATARAETVVAQLPTGGHWTRDIVFSADDRQMFVAIGSLSNVAQGQRRLADDVVLGFEAGAGRGASWDDEEDRAVVLTFTPEGERIHTLATGLRNCSGLALEPVTGLPWCAVNERDGLGDDLPPDYATSVLEGRFYGWPWYYIGDLEDPRHAGARPDLAGEVTVPDVLLQPHSAPLGITFYGGEAFPAEYRGDGFVALHGSWNRAERTGYKVVRLIMENGVATGVYEDFITGFVISERAVWGRPVGVEVMRDGSLLVSEDANGTIWRVRYDGG